MKSKARTERSTSVDKSKARSDRIRETRNYERKLRQSYQDDSFDCGQKVCFLEHAMVANCYIYLYSNKTHCDIPCDLTGCDRELHHFISCPIWICNPKTTTTTTTPTTTTTAKTTITTSKTTTRTTPKPTTTTMTPYPTTTTTTIGTTKPTTTTTVPTTTNAFPIDHPGVLYSSLCLNIFLTLIVLFMLFLKCKKAVGRAIRRFRRPARNSNQQRSVRRTIDDYFRLDSSSEDFDTPNTNVTLANETNPLLASGQRPGVPFQPQFPNLLTEPLLSLPGPTGPLATSDHRLNLPSDLNAQNLIQTAAEVHQHHPLTTNTTNTNPRVDPLLKRPTESLPMSTFKPKPPTPERTSSLKETTFV